MKVPHWQKCRPCPRFDFFSLLRHPQGWQLLCLSQNQKKDPEFARLVHQNLAKIELEHPKWKKPTKITVFLWFFKPFSIFCWISTNQARQQGHYLKALQEQQCPRSSQTMVESTNILVWYNSKYKMAISSKRTLNISKISFQFGFLWIPSKTGTQN